MAVLRLVPIAGPPVEVDKDQAIVGREPGCDVYVNDGSVSRRHARLERRGSAWFVVDQGSANGTYLDSQRVSDALLRPGQELRFGAVAFKVELPPGAASADGTILSPAGMGYPPAPPPGAPPQWPSAPPSPPQWPAPPGAPPAPPRPPQAPPPPPSTDTAPYAAGVPARRPRPPRPQGGAGEAPPPPRPGRGPVFWIGMGCGGCLLAVLLLGSAFFGFIYLAAKGPRDALHAHLGQLRAGNVDAAYDSLSQEYRQRVSREAFAAFVARHPALKQNADSTIMHQSSEGSRASLSGHLTGPGGARENATFALVKEGGAWRIADIDVEADHPDAPVEQGPAGLRIDSVEARKTVAGSTVEVRVALTASGFDVRPAGGQFEIDLAVDVETIGPDGLRLEALSRDDVQRFQRTTTMERGAVAPMAIPLIVDRSLPEGAYTVRLRVRDRVGGGQATAETQVSLP